MGVRCSHSNADRPTEPTVLVLALFLVPFHDDLLPVPVPFAIPSPVPSQYLALYLFPPRYPVHDSRVHDVYLYHDPCSFPSPLVYLGHKELIEDRSNYRQVAEVSMKNLRAEVEAEEKNQYACHLNDDGGGDGDGDHER